MPIVNAWTEFGDLEYVCVGSSIGAQYPDLDPSTPFNVLTDKEFEKFMVMPLGPRPKTRIQKAEAELQNLVDILEGEKIIVGSISEVDEDIKEELRRKRSYVSQNPKNAEDDIRIEKKRIEVFRPPESKFDHLIITPWWKNYYQFSNACPRDVIITLGNTILETPTSSRVRYFESTYYRSNLYNWWKKDPKVHWKTAPQPSCSDSMFRSINISKSLPYETPLNDAEIAFDAADLMRCGKDIFYKRSKTANNLGIQWLRKEFPDLRFHMLHFPKDISCHLDVNIALLRPPTSGSDGIIMMNSMYHPLKSQMNLFLNNEWTPIFGPLPITNKVSPTAVCSSSLNMNFLSLSPNCVIIEECEIPLYNVLTDLGWDVITAPLRSLNEFGGGIHCVTWDIRRNDACKDYFPIQDYKAECQIDLENFSDIETFDGDLRSFA